MEWAEKIPLAAALARLAQSRADEEAWTSLYLAAWPLVMAINYRLLHGAREAAKDASQEVFLRLIRYGPMGELQEPEAFRSYLRMICRNVSRSYLRRLQQRGETELAEALSLQPALAEAEIQSPAAEAETQELLDRLLGVLAPQDQKLVKLLALGYTLPEIAKITHLSYSNVAVRLHRLRKKLRDYLADKAAQPDK